MNLLLLHGHEDDPCQDDQQEEGWSSLGLLTNLLAIIALFSNKSSNIVPQEVQSWTQLQ